MKRIATVLALGLSLWLGSAHAAVDYFLKVGDIDGEATQKDHENWIDVFSFSWGLSNASSGGGGAGGGTGKAVFSDFSWMQGLDSSVVPLFLAVASGQRFETATFDVVRTGDRSETFFQMIFGDASPNSLSLSGAGDDIFASASLGADMVTMRYRPQDERGGYGDWIEGTWDLRRNAPAVFSGDPNVLTGLLLAGPTSVRIDADIGVVPEPATGALMAGGLLLLYGLRRRQRR